MASSIAFRDVWVEYGDQIVLERINLTIAPGSFVSLVGPSGAGKSTLLRMILGQERPTRGQILLDGKPLSPEPGPDRGVVFQRYSVFPHLSVLGNVLLGFEFGASPLMARLFGAARRKAIDKCDGLIEAVGLAEHRDKYPALSGGMQQRLAIAQALAQRAQCPAAGRAVRRARSRHPRADARTDQAAVARAQDDHRHGHARHQGSLRARHAPCRARQAASRSAGARALRRHHHLRSRPHARQRGARAGLHQTARQVSAKPRRAQP